MEHVDMDHPQGHADGGRGGGYTKAEVAKQQQRCYELRIKHWSIRQIAKMTGLASSTVHKRIENEIAETVEPARAKYRTMELARLDEMSRLVWVSLEEHHYVVSEGRIVRDGDESIEDYEFMLKAVDRLLKIQERRAKLEGLDAPTKVDATVTEVTQADLELTDMIAEAKAKVAAEEARLKAQA